MEVQVDIVVQTITAQYGTLNPGDTLRTNAAFAAHLVDECRAAKYRKAPVALRPEAAVETVSVESVAGIAADVQTSAQADPYAHLGTLVAVVKAEPEVQTSAHADHVTDGEAKTPKPRKRAANVEAVEEK